jgi:hypothetical protein
MPDTPNTLPDGNEQLRAMAESSRGLAARVRNLGALQEQSLQQPLQPRRWRGPGMEDVHVDDLPAVWAARQTPAEAAHLNEQRLRLLDREAERLREARARRTPSPFEAVYRVNCQWRDRRAQSDGVPTAPHCGLCNPPVWDGGPHDRA